MKTKHGMILIAVLIISLAGCAGSVSRTTTTGRVNHIVLCWLKEPGNIAHREKIIEVSKSFRTIPRVLQVRVGQVIPSDRKIVDDSFDVGVCISFDNAEDMNTYLDHPLHTKAAKEVLRPLADRIVVYDFLE